MCEREREEERKNEYPKCQMCMNKSAYYTISNIERLKILINSISTLVYTGVIFNWIYKTKLNPTITISNLKLS